MPSTYEILKRDIPILEKKYGSDDPYVQQLKQQLADIEKEPDPEETPPETDEDYAMVVPNPKDN